METEIITTAQELDFSILALFLRASIIVQMVMVMLLLASFWSWSVIFQKLINFKLARREVNDFTEIFWSGKPLDKVYQDIGRSPKGAAKSIFAAGMAEWRRSHKNDGGLIAGAQARIDRAMNVSIGKANDSLNSGLTYLGTVGSIAPFIGLFGTVWGIKNAFENIAMQQSTNLAVVAPGIAEALLATALGLLAAIPAVIFYNKLSADADQISAEYESFADEFSMVLSRQLDEDH